MTSGALQMPRRSLTFGMSTTLAAALLAASPARTVQAAPTDKDPWRWSLDERIDARSAAALQQKATAERGQSLSPRRYVLRGSETPQYFLEWELFDHLVQKGFPEHAALAASSRESVMAKAAALGFGADFWGRFERAVAPFLEARWRDLELGAREAKARVPAELSSRGPVEFCRLRSAALNAVKDEFGEERLLRLLYEVVAPPIEGTYITDDEVEEEAERLRYIAEGCP